MKPAELKKLQSKINALETLVAKATAGIAEIKTLIAPASTATESAPAKKTAATAKAEPKKPAKPAAKIEGKKATKK